MVRKLKKSKVAKIMYKMLLSKISKIIINNFKTEKKYIFNKKNWPLWIKL